MTPSAPVGIFDSGVGGLSVARDIHRLQPHEALLYFADAAFCPYGGRPAGLILERASKIGHFLASSGCKLIVVACNTASAAALELLREQLPLPIVGLEPALKPAAELTRKRRVAVLATEATLAAERFDRLIQRFAAGVHLEELACPGFVEAVERGATDAPELAAVVGPVAERLRAADVDVVVLGCTHYPFLAGALRRSLGPEMIILDSGEAVARQTQRVLEEASLLATAGTGELQLATSGDAEAVSAVASRLWGSEIAAAPVRL